MSNAGSSSLGASPKYLTIDLTTTVPPFTFRTAFLAAYPTMGERPFESRTIVALAEGTLTLIDPEGAHVPWPMAEGEANAIQATGVHETDGVTSIKVML